MAKKSPKSGTKKRAAVPDPMTAVLSTCSRRRGLRQCLGRHRAHIQQREGRPEVGGDERDDGGGGPLLQRPLCLHVVREDRHFSYSILRDGP